METEKAPKRGLFCYNKTMWGAHLNTDEGGDPGEAPDYYGQFPYVAP